MAKNAPPKLNPFLHLLQQTAIGLFLLIVLFALHMKFLDVLLLKWLPYRIYHFMEQTNLVFLLFLIPDVLSAYLTGLFTKEKPILYNTLTGTILGVGTLSYLILSSKEAWGASDFILFGSFCAIHIFCYSLTGFFIHRRRQQKLDAYEITDERINSFGKNLPENK